MKKSTWLGILVLPALLLAAVWLVDRKPPEKANPPVASRAAAESPTPVARIGSPPVAAASEETPENTRTRPLPRPEDPKHKPAPPLRTEFPIAAMVEDKPGFVFSPFNNKIIDVRGMPPGTLVSDPSFPETERKYFRTP